MFLFLAPSPIIQSQRNRYHPCHQCVCKKRIVPCANANINQTNNSDREDEIAAKIASLRKYKRLKSQRAASEKDSDGNSEKDGQNNENEQFTLPGQQDRQDNNNFFDQLPDWKKKELLNSQMAEAEQFFNKGATNTPSPPPNTTNSDPQQQPQVITGSYPTDTPTAPPSKESDEQKYKPKVSTWGVFPRPDNISRTYGGGRKIRPGGVNLKNENAKQRDAKVAQKLAAYRTARGMDTKQETEHREEIEEALESAESLMRKAQPYQAIDALESVSSYVSPRSRLGGRLLLSLALAYEAVGRREDARKEYSRIRNNPFPEISTNARRLQQGLAAMTQLGVDDETSSRGFRVGNFVLPDLNDVSEKRYETVIIPSSKRRETNDGEKSEDGDWDGSSDTSVDASTNWVLLAVILLPVVMVFLARTWLTMQ